MVKAILEPKEDAEEVADFLVGTCGTLEGALEACGVSSDAPDNEDFCKELDSRVFCCDSCGWWCPAEDQHSSNMGMPVCDECAPETGDD